MIDNIAQIIIGQNASGTDVFHVGVTIMLVLTWYKIFWGDNK